MKNDDLDLDKLNPLTTTRDDIDRVGYRMVEAVLEDHHPEVGRNRMNSARVTCRRELERLVSEGLWMEFKGQMRAMQHEDKQALISPDDNRIFKLRIRQWDSHVHIDFFLAPAEGFTWINCGTLQLADEDMVAFLMTMIRAGVQIDNRTDHTLEGWVPDSFISPDDHTQYWRP